ncbi:MAG: RNA methyltransferase [Candidatus Marinimicrobia bacterium]|nr:RNA methyltransferase [Candidatus Neomarinimicrobiota bacterium]
MKTDEERDEAGESGGGPSPEVLAALDEVRVVLVRPIYGGNVGAVCRAMWNCGLSKLAVVAPHPELDWEEARIRAYRAAECLAARAQYDTLAEAVADCGVVAGTTARLGLYRSHARTPRAWAPELLAAAAQCPVALVFGPEDKGLSNEQLALCNRIIQIPSSDRYSSLNLSHAVMICAYELFVAAEGCTRGPQEWSPEAPSALRERMFALWRATLLAVGFMKEEKAEHMMLGLRRILSRGSLTINDVKILMGIARQAHWAATRQPPPRGDLAEEESE